MKLLTRNFPKDENEWFSTIEAHDDVFLYYFVRTNLLQTKRHDLLRMKCDEGTVQHR